VKLYFGDPVHFAAGEGDPGGNSVVKSKLAISIHLAAVGGRDRRLRMARPQDRGALVQFRFGPLPAPPV
jgi:hypothetical protein